MVLKISRIKHFAKTIVSYISIMSLGVNTLITIGNNRNIFLIPFWKLVTEKKMQHEELDLCEAFRMDL